MPKARLRDRYGRFKAKPKPPLPAALVAQLGQGRRAVEWTADVYHEIEILKRWTYLVDIGEAEHHDRPSQHIGTDV